jgi:hypothetical protein
MKKNILLLIFILVSVQLFAQEPTIIILNGKQMITYPDVMNFANIQLSDNNISNNNTILLDTFPNFSGFPKHIYGNSFEGGIYCNMDSDPELEVVYCIGYTIQAWNINGSDVTGWPKNMSYPAQGAPSYGDINGDGQEEIVVGTNSGSTVGYIYAYKKDGSTVTGFPINHGYTTRTIVLADINNDNKMEIITNKRLGSLGEVWVYKGDGTVYPGWPKSINHVPASSCGVGDINGDNFPEIVAESYSSVYAWDKDGNILSGFPYTPPGGDVFSYSSPVLADMDGDNIREILVGTHILGGGGGVYILKNNGILLSGWPSMVNYWIYGPPAVGFINNDNILDIAVGDQVLSGTPVDRLYAWDKNANLLSGFPIYNLNAINNQVTLADIDNDNLTELIIDDNTQSSGIGKYLAFNHDGTLVTGWPIITTGTSFFNTPCITDVNRDGILDILGGAMEGSGANTYINVYLWNTGKNYNTSRIYNPIWQYNARHNGVYGDINLIVGLPVTENKIPKDFMLFQNYPNPFNPITVISYQLVVNSYASLKVYDVLGKEVVTLVNGQQKAGIYNIDFNGTNYPSGVYFYELTVGDFKELKKMVLIK